MFFLATKENNLNEKENQMYEVEILKIQSYSD